MTPNLLPPGIHDDLAAADYHADVIAPQPSLSAGIAHILTTSTPLHAWHAHPRLNPAQKDKERGAFDLGTVAHLLLLEGDQYADKITVIDAADWRTTTAKEGRAEAREAGLTPLLAKDWERVVEMVACARMQLNGRHDEPPLLADGKPEQTLVWQEPNGVMCRARLDWLRNDHQAVDDLKTTSASANPHDWARRTFWSIGCDIQVAFYLRGVRALTGARPSWRYILVETEAPYAVSVVTVGPSVLELGQRKVERAIRLWGECLETGEWGSYPDSPFEVELEGWQEADFLRRTWVEQQAVPA